MGDRIPDVASRVATPATVEVREEHGRISLVRQRYGPTRRALARLMRLPTTLTVHLDELGSAAWRLVDGKRTVGQIRAELERQFPSESDLASRLGRFVGMMVSRGFVRLS